MITAKRSRSCTTLALASVAAASTSSNCTVSLHQWKRIFNRRVKFLLLP